MTEYISRQAAIEALRDYFDDQILWDDKGSFVAECCEEAINDVPTADVRENVSAKWIDMDSDSERYDDIRCSNCKHSYTVDAYRWCDIGFIAGDLKYCPNCGADITGRTVGVDMRGEYDDKQH